MQNYGRTFIFIPGFLIDIHRLVRCTGTAGGRHGLTSCAGKPLLRSWSLSSMGKLVEHCGGLDSRKAGFTLLEIVIVLVLATFIAALSTVSFMDMLPSAKLAATARDISATIRYARSLAQINGEAQAVMIDLDSRNYSLAGHGTKLIPSEVFMKVTDPFAGDVYQGRYTIVAYTSGAVSGCTIVLWNRKKTLSIQTDPVVGAVIIK